MPVKLKSGYELGWKKNNPNDQIFCIYFIDEKTNRELFKYAPKYSDIVFFKHAFRELIRYEFDKLQKLSRKLLSNKLQSMGKDNKWSNDNLCSGSTVKDAYSEEWDDTLCSA
jgi:hypothetical protein